MRILFVDDELTRFLQFRDMNGADNEIWWAQSVDAADQLLSAFMFSVVCLDHDLGVRPDVDGEFPENLTIRPPFPKLDLNDRPFLIGTTFIIHTSNPVARDWMREELVVRMGHDDVRIVSNVWQKMLEI